MSKEMTKLGRLACVPLCPEDVSNGGRLGTKLRVLLKRFILVANEIVLMPADMDVCLG